MNVRDLSQYITKLCGQETFGLLGTNKELLLQKIYGSDPSSDQVKKVIADAASFASNAEEQLFYEFVQNAYDAGADSLFFYAGKEHLIVLNNGEPFYTDSNIFNADGNVRDGQLYNFLAKGKSLKHNDNSKLGKYGQGSKLLYTLLADTDESEENENLLIRTLYEERKGPYLISWNDRKQLANLLQERGEWSHASCDDYRDNILFAKILMTYYPIAPGTSETLFSTAEALSAIKAFDTLVDPRRNLHFLNRGTALIIPLGHGKYERITADENLERVRTRLGLFASITKDQERNGGKSVEHICIMGQEVEQHEVQSVFVNFEVNGKPFHYHFAFNPAFAEKQVVSLFKGLPILETKFRLGFIIDSQRFEVDNSRQRILDKEKAKDQLSRAFAELVKELITLKESHPQKFSYIYRSIAATCLQDGGDVRYVRDAFREVFTPFFEKFVLTSDGEYANYSNVRDFTEDFCIPLKDIGITRYAWIDHTVKNDLKRQGIKIEETDFATLLADADESMLKDWILSLPTETYHKLFAICDKHKDKDGVKNVRLFLTDRGNLFSYEELRSKKNVYFPLEGDMPWGECEHVGEVLTGVDETTYIDVLFNKIKANVAEFRKSDSAKDDAANLLQWIAQKSDSYVKHIKSDVLLLENRHNVCVSFEELMAERPENTILFDNYLVNGYIPEAVKTEEWLLNPSKEKKACWKWVKANWESLKADEQWGGGYSHRYIADVKKVYDKAPHTDKDIYGRLKEEKLELYLDEDGRPTSQQHCIVSNARLLTEDEYHYIAMNVARLRFIPYEYWRELTTPPFKFDKAEFSDIIGGRLEADEKLLRILIKISGDKFLKYYRTEATDGSYAIIPLYSNYKHHDHNYADVVDTDLEDELLAAHFYHIPDRVQEIVGEESRSYSFAFDNEMLGKAIESISHPLMLLPIVKQANAKTIDKFFFNLESIHIDGEISKNSLEWQVIELAVQRHTDENGYIDCLLGIIRHNGEKLPESITKRYVSVGDKEYDVYSLDSEYKDNNHAIESFLKCLPSPNEAAFFRQHFYHGKEEDISAKALFDDLKGYYLSVDQLRFCLDYAITNEDDCDNLELDEDVNITEALNMILKNGFEGFDRHYKMHDVNLERQVYAPQRLLLTDECLPDTLHLWLDSHPEAAKLFTRLTTEDDPFITVRRALLDGDARPDVSSFENAELTPAAQQTLEWAIFNDLTYAYRSARYDTMMDIIRKLPEGRDVMPFLRYTGETLPGNQPEDTPIPTFRLEWQQKDASFLSAHKWAGKFATRLYQSTALAEFIRNNIVYMYDTKELLYKHGLQKCPIWDVRTSPDSADSPEYDDPVYREWKASDEAKGYTIHVTNTPIVTNFNITAGNACIFSDTMHDSEFGCGTGKQVFVQQPNKDGLSMMKTIAKHIDEAGAFNAPFIALQALYIDHWERMQQDGGVSSIDLSDSALTEEQAQEAINKISAETAEHIKQVNGIAAQLDTHELDKLSELASPIKALMGELGNDGIERLADKKERLKQLMDELDEDDERAAQVRPIIGFIGELIYSHYLEQKHLVRGKDFVHAALYGVGEYDFKIRNKSQLLYVDVKTTVYSLTDGTAPFYLHRSQNRFMQQHPNARYHIVRISLIDLDLRKAYEKLRDDYGQDANPLENSMLMEQCEGIARGYWKSATLEEFDALAPEYAIRIEQRKSAKAN